MYKKVLLGDGLIDVTVFVLFIIIVRKILVEISLGMSDIYMEPTFFCMKMSIKFSKPVHVTRVLNQSIVPVRSRSAIISIVPS